MNLKYIVDNFRMCWNNKSATHQNCYGLAVAVRSTILENPPPMPNYQWVSEKYGRAEIPTETITQLLTEATTAVQTNIPEIGSLVVIYGEYGHALGVFIGDLWDGVDDGIIYYGENGKVSIDSDWKFTNILSYWNIINV